jgi:Cyclic nucleotide-binding domain
MTEIAPSPTTVRPVLDSLTQRLAQERMFPTLTAAQIQRVAMGGQLRAIRSGEVLIEAGAQVVPFFVVTAGRVEIVRPSGTTEMLVAVHAPGQFPGVVNMLFGRPALGRARASALGEVIEVDHEHLLALVQTGGGRGQGRDAGREFQSVRCTVLACHGQDRRRRCVLSGKQSPRNPIRLTLKVLRFDFH